MESLLDKINNNLDKMNNSNINIKIIQKSNINTKPKNGQKVIVNYKGLLPNGKVFDSSWDKGTPFSFIVGNGDVIKGWDISIKKIKLGEKVKINIPSKLAYGSKGIPGHIPPNTNLIFIIKLLKIQDIS